MRETTHAAVATTDELDGLLAAQERRLFLPLKCLPLKCFKVLPPWQPEARRLLQQPRAPQKSDVLSPKCIHKIVVKRGEGLHLLRQVVKRHTPRPWRTGHRQTGFEQIAAIAQGGLPAVEVVAGEDEAVGVE